MKRTVAIAIVAVLVTVGCTGPSQPVVEDAYLLGTVIRVSIYDSGYDSRLIESVFQRVAQIESRMSTSEDDYDTTELLRVNRAAAGTPTSVSPDTYHVLTAAKEYSEVSNGAFDVTIWPLVRLWKIGSGGTSVPPKEEIEAARDLVDHTGLQLLPNDRVALSREGMGVDVGAIAKGYAADEAAAILIDVGVKHALLDFGGNILAIGGKPDGSPWRIGVQRPDAERSRYIGIVRTRNRTVVTSGPYERFFEEDGVRYHHILNPKTGYPSRNGLEQVTIVAMRSIDADALSTTSYVLGLDAAFQLVASTPGVEAIFVTETREVYVTPGIQIIEDADETDQNGEEISFQLTDAEYVIVR